MAKLSKRWLRRVAVVALVTAGVLMAVSLTARLLGVPLQVLWLIAVLIVMVGAGAIIVEKQRD